VRFDRALIAVMARTHGFVTGLPAWPLRTVSWVLFGPRRACNRSVAEQLAFAGATPSAQGEAAAEPAEEPAPTAGKKAAAPAVSADDPEAPLDDDTAAEVEALLAKARPSAQRGGAGARPRRPTPGAASELAPPRNGGRPTPGGPSPRAGRTR
jgi:hypothetical protein